MKVALIKANDWHEPLYLDALERSRVQCGGRLRPRIFKGRPDRGTLRLPLPESCRELLDRSSVDFAFAFGRHVEMRQIGEALIERTIPFAIVQGV